MNDVRVMLIGLDGGTWNLIKPWAESGKLSTFKKLMRQGVWGNLESTIPPITIPAWASMVTGKNPGKIGAIHFLMRERNSYNFKPVRLRIDRINPLWKFLNRYKKTTYLFYVPSILPNLKEFKGMYVPGEFVFINKEAYHPLAAKTLIEKFGLSEIAPDFKKTNAVEYIRKWKVIVERHFNLILHFLENDRAWDFLMYVIYSTDHLSHLFWKYLDKKHPYYEENNEISIAILEYYKAIDTALNHIFKISKSKKIFLFLVSDHGHGPLVKRIDLNKWLQQQGYLVLKNDTKMPKNDIKSNTRLKIFNTFLNKSRFIHKYLRRNERVKYFLRHLLVAQKSISSDIIDWNSTKAYFSGYNGININIKGREPQGTIPLKDYDLLRNELINKLKILKDPESEKNVVRRIWKREEIYTGNFVEKLPDILIEYEKISEYESVFKFSDTIIKEDLFYKPKDPPVSSAHLYDGMFLAYGPDIKQETKISEATIYDITPTILHIFGLSLPNDIDGMVLMELFESNSEIAKRKPVYEDSSYYDKLDERLKLRKKIKDLKLKGKI